jgi:uncharacterized protein YqcC (DUF446 family)
MAEETRGGPDPRKVAEYADRIEAEMRAIALWQASPLDPAKLNFEEAFATDTMAFPQWLQFVFLPRVRESVKTGDYPSSSQVGAQAVREFDGFWEANDLNTLLSDFDALFRI